MHELSITRHMMNTALNAFDSTTMKRITTIYLAIGEMMDYEEKWLQYYLDSMNSGTPLEGAKIKIKKIPVKLKCRGCGEEFNPESRSFSLPECPVCGGKNSSIINGREFEIERMEVEEIE